MSARSQLRPHALRAPRFVAGAALFLLLALLSGCGNREVGATVALAPDVDPLDSQTGAAIAELEKEVAKSFPVDTASFHEQYKLGAGDIIDVAVFRVPEFSGAFTVSEAGMISMPLLGEVKVISLTPKQVADLLRIRLGDSYLNDPNVRVDIKEYRSRQAVVMGAVTKPGAVSITGPTTLIDLVAKAGGLNEKHDESLMVFRSVGGETLDQQGRRRSRPVERRHVKIRVEELLRLGNPAVNIPIQDGDLVYIPTLGTIFLRGPVARQGEIGLTNSIQTVSHVITMAGGLLYAAEGDMAFILRQQGSAPRVRIPVSIEQILAGQTDDIRLRARDELIIPANYTRSVLADIGNFIRSIFNPNIGGTLNVFGPGL